VVGTAHTFRLSRPLQQWLQYVQTPADAAAQQQYQQQQQLLQQQQQQQQQLQQQQQQQQLQLQQQPTAAPKRGRGYTKLKLAELQAELMSRGLSNLPKGKTALMAGLQRLDAAAAAETAGKQGEQARVLAELNAETSAAAAALVAEQERKRDAKKAAKREKRETAGAASRAAAAAAEGTDGDADSKPKRTAKKKVPLEPPGACDSLFSSPESVQLLDLVVCTHVIQLAHPRACAGADGAPQFASSKPKPKGKGKGKGKGTMSDSESMDDRAASPADDPPPSPGDRGPWPPPASDANPIGLCPPPHPPSRPALQQAYRTSSL
jgi:hypothetical protein